MEIKTTNILFGATILTMLGVIGLASYVFIHFSFQYILQWEWANIVTYGIAGIVITVSCGVATLLLNQIGEPIAKRLLK